MSGHRDKEIKRLATVVGREQAETAGGKKVVAMYGIGVLIESCYKGLKNAYKATPKPQRAGFFKAAKGRHLNPALYVARDYHSR